MGHVDVAGVRYELPDGRVLLDDVSFRVGDGAKVALVGANGAGKTTLLRIVTGEVAPHAGAVTRSGGLGAMRQLVGHGGDDETVADLLLSLAPERVRAAQAAVDDLELALMETEDEATQLRYASALAEYAEAGGYDLEVLWDVCTTAAMGVPFERARYRALGTLSGGEQKRLALEYLLRGPDQVLLLDEPDNYLDVPGKTWLEERIRESAKTILFVSHDRELLANTATRVVTVELGAAGNQVWTHAGGFATYHEARRGALRTAGRAAPAVGRGARQAAGPGADVQAEGRLQRRTWPAATRPRRPGCGKFEEAGPPTEQPREQRVRMRLSGGRTGKRAVVCEGLGLTGLMRAVRPGGLVRRAGRGARLERLGQVALPAAAGRRRDAIRSASTCRWATSRRARCGTPGEPGWARAYGPAGSCRPTTTPSWWAARCWRSCTAATTTGPGCPASRPRACSTATSWPARASNGSRRSPAASRRGSRSCCWSCPAPRCCCSTSRPTTSTCRAPRRSRTGWSAFEGTVLAVTHDRWFARGFDRFLVFGADGEVVESPEPVWHEGRVRRDR